MSQLPIVSSDVEALPTRPEERERLRRMGARSLLALPLVAGGEVLGGLALVSTTTHRSWPEPVVANSRLVADVLAGALARMLAEDALRASESMKSAVLSSLTSLVAVLDRDGRIIAVNESWTRFGRLHSQAASVVGPGEGYVDACRRAARTGEWRAGETISPSAAARPRRATSPRARRSSASRACSSAAFRASPRTTAAPAR